MDAGDRWMLMDAAGKPMLAWDINETPQGTASTAKSGCTAPTTTRCTAPPRNG